ncbi:NAD(P) transhydrogenase subunit alpha [Paroceanicella profunda]|uniref:proton-translocating NAD(P)(+) transhydrogenase n=1 Tax=Paroceanicella profunda TaxID=2579971 RepID=A0A5B8FZB9_9RHOB|nr:proton-translocating transhydrogenase family protein [Paroceanicella profunda]QDL91972.1 NAD(P) transhydrogenase subunit alpha [Paroceanicella profunda]
MEKTLEDLALRLAELSAQVAELSTHAATGMPQAAEAASDAALHGGASPFVYLFSAFVLACFVGYYVVWSVTPALHTPLMSVTNAVSSVIVVGALIAVGVDLDIASGWTRVFGFIATVLAAVNIFGGFLVTERMLAMYKKKG